MVLVFIAPLPAILLNLIFDDIDGYFFVQAGISEEIYGLIDKSLDWAWYFALMLAVIVNEADGIILFTLIVLFIHRSVGEVLFFRSRNRKYLFYFPNFFEIAAWNYFIFDYLGLGIDVQYFLITALLCLVIKMPQEYILNYKNQSFMNIIFNTDVMSWNKRQKK
jgi:hypothetical protein